MNAILKGILTTLENTARQSVPGGALVDDAVHAVVEAKGGNREEAIINAVQAGFSELELFKPEMIADTVMFNAGVIEAHDALIKIQNSLKKPAAGV